MVNCLVIPRRERQKEYTLGLIELGIHSLVGVKSKKARNSGKIFDRISGAKSRICVGIAVPVKGV